MNTNDNEATTIHNNYEEPTQIVDTANTENAINTESNQAEQEAASEISEKRGIAKKIATVAGGAVLLGSASTIIMGMKGVEAPENPNPVDTPTEEVVKEGINLEGVIETLEILKEGPVNDEMTFEEAFSAAREAQGAGSAFEWHGNVYATYTKEEWDRMTVEEKSDFYDSLHIPNPFSASADVEIEAAVASTDDILAAEAVAGTSPELKTENNGQESASNTKPEETIVAQVASQPLADSNSDDIEIVSVGNAGDHDIEILGVTQDISTGYSVGHLSVDGEEVVVIDVDGDMVFDSIIADLNHDGDITSDEIIDIRQHSITLDDLNGHNDFISDTLGPNGDTPDYLSEL